MRLILVIVVALVLVHCVFSQKQGITTGNRSGNGSGKTGRAISTNPEPSNKLKTDAEDETVGDTDSAFDIIDSGGINFPTDDPPPPPPKANVSSHKPYKPIPKKILVRFGNEMDISSLIKKYVHNVKVVTNSSTQEEYLADPTGNVLFNERQEKVIITPGIEQFNPVVSSRTRTATSLPAGSSRARSGSIQPSPPFPANDASKTRPFLLPVCSPENKTVPVNLTVQPHILIIPRCLRVERCGGCCMSSIMVCEPETMDTVEFLVKELAYVGEEGTDKRPLEFVSERVVQMERHTSCKCKCRTKPEHCSQMHTYVEDECSCVCKNQNEYLSCLNESNKIWDQDSCMCTCREIRDCSSGLFYNLNTCQCEREFRHPRQAHPHTPRIRKKKSTKV